MKMDRLIGILLQLQKVAAPKSDGRDSHGLA